MRTNIPPILAQGDTSVGLKVYQATTYSKTQLYTSYAQSALVSDVAALFGVASESIYVDALLVLKANQSDKATALGLKSNQATTYTKTAVATALHPTTTTTYVGGSIIHDYGIMPQGETGFTVH